MRNSLSAIVIAVLLKTLLAQDPLAIRVDVKLVNVAFTARDSSGKLVADLTRDDVEVFDDGVRRRFRFCAERHDRWLWA